MPGQNIWPPLHPYLRESLMLYRNGVHLWRNVQAHNNQTREVIPLLQWWLNEGDLDLPQLDPLEDTLSLFQESLVVNSLGQESLRQRLRHQRDGLFDLVMNSPLVQRPRMAIHCRTTRDIDAVHTLGLLGDWPQHLRDLFRVGIDQSEDADSPVPPQRLVNYARSLNCQVFNFW